MNYHLQILDYIIEFIPFIVFGIIIFTFKSHILPGISKFIFKGSLLMAMNQISQNPEEFKKNKLISDIADKDKLIREFQKFKKIKKIVVPKGVQSTTPNSKEKIYEATVMTIDGVDRVYRFIAKQITRNSAINSPQSVAQFKLVSFQQIA